MMVAERTVFRFSPTLTTKVHPLVSFNISDCYVRRPDQTEHHTWRVIDTLFNRVLPDGTIDTLTTRTPSSVFGLLEAIGVADGVGGWADVGVNTGLFTRELMAHSLKEIQEEHVGSFEPARVLENA